MARKADPRPAALAIVGPTASGKSAAALALAEHFDGTIINADSMQLYRELRILTARPSAMDMAARPHVLYGVAEAADPWSAARWRGAALAEIARVRAAERLPILVGGTGLYVRSLAEGLAEVPPIPAAIRAAARARREDIGALRFHGELAARDPVMAARLAPGDTQRVLRAYEVIVATGTSLAAFQAATPEEPAVVLGVIALLPDRETLDPAIAARCARMIEDGALDEVAAFNALALPPGTPARKALGVRELSRHLAGELDLSAAVDRFRIATRQYAKRQRTWFRHQTIASDGTIVINEQFNDKSSAAILSFVREFVDRHPVRG